MRFTSGLVTGALLTVGVTMLTHPMSKRDMRRTSNNVSRFLRRVSRTF